MTWNKPNTEDDWNEWISAYIDGELNDQDRRALESALAANPKRAEQVAAWRAMSVALEEWRVEEEPPTPAFLYALEKVERQPRRKERRPAAGLGWRRLGFQGALFLLGAVCGIAVTLAVVHPANPEKDSDSETALVAEDIALASSRPTISAGQAERLLQEVEAQKLKAQAIDAVRQGRRADAERLYQRLSEQFSGTETMHDLGQLPAFGPYAWPPRKTE